MRCAALADQLRRGDRPAVTLPLGVVRAVGAEDHQRRLAFVGDLGTVCGCRMDAGEVARRLLHLGEAAGDLSVDLVVVLGVGAVLGDARDAGVVASQ